MVGLGVRALPRPPPPPTRPAAWQAATLAGPSQEGYRDFAGFGGLNRRHRRRRPRPHSRAAVAGSKDGLHRTWSGACRCTRVWLQRVHCCASRRWPADHTAAEASVSAARLAVAHAPDPVFNCLWPASPARARHLRDALAIEIRLAVSHMPWLLGGSRRSVLLRPRRRRARKPSLRP